MMNEVANLKPPETPMQGYGYTMRSTSEKSGEDSADQAV
jgi:hypothetical protein